MATLKSLRNRIRGWLPQEPLQLRRASLPKLRAPVAILLVISLVAVSSFAGYMAYLELRPPIPTTPSSTTNWPTGEIYIYPDGLWPASASSALSRNGDVYTFTGNISDPIYVEASNVVLNGAGYSMLDFGVEVTAESNVTIENLKMAQTGIELQGSNNDTIKNSYIVGNVGILIRGGYNTITNNSIVNTPTGNQTGWSSPIGLGDPLDCGVEIDSQPVLTKQTLSDFNNITNNHIYNYGSGIMMWNSSENYLANNYLTGDSEGVILEMDANNNTLVGNTITKSSLYAVSPNQANNNTFYGNNFIDNTCQVVDGAFYMSIQQNVSVNFWDNGSIGNYWSDYQTMYPKATESSTSGIENVPYQIYAQNVDNYPLAKPTSNTS